MRGYIGFDGMLSNVEYRIFKLGNEICLGLGII